MDFSMKQALHFVVTIVVAVMIVSAFGNFLNMSSNSINQKNIDDSYFLRDTINQGIANKSEPVLEIQDIHLQKNLEGFNIDLLKGYATAHDSDENDISSQIEVAGNVDITIAGVYKVRYSVEDSVGRKTAYIKNVIVDEESEV